MSIKLEGDRQVPWGKIKEKRGAGHTGRGWLGMVGREGDV